MNRRRFFLKIGALWAGSIIVPRFSLADGFNPTVIGVYEQMLRDYPYRACGSIADAKLNRLPPEELEKVFNLFQPRTNFTQPDLSHLEPIHAVHVPTLRDLLGQLV